MEDKRFPTESSSIEDSQSYTRNAHTSTRPSRRSFLRNLTGGAATLASSGALLPALAAGPDDTRGDASQRAVQAYHVRQEAAKTELQMKPPDHISNEDEGLHTNRIGNFSK